MKKIFCFILLGTILPVMLFAQVLGSDQGNTLEVNAVNGSVGSNMFINKKWLVRTAAGATWNTVRLHDGIGIDVSFLTPQVSTRTWWERDAYNNVQSWGTAGVTYFTLNNGAAGFNTATPQGTLQVKGASAFDSPTRVYITNNATDNGRTNLVLTGRFYNGNDGWNFGSNARNSIVFAQNTATASGQAVGELGTERFSLQLEGNSGSLGFLSATLANTPVAVLTQAGSMGIGTSTPSARLDVNGNAVNTLNSVLARLPEGNANTGAAGTGTFLGVRALNTAPLRSSSFALQHVFYGSLNSAINFHRGDAVLGGFLSFATNDGTEKMRLDASGNLCVGTTDARGNKLAVNGFILSKKITVSQDWADFVFDSAYRLQPLSEVENYIARNQHLPGFPSAAEIEKEGLNLGEICQQQQVKIEELTLHLIAEQKERITIEQKLKEQEDKIMLLQQAVEKLLGSKQQ